MFEEFEKLFNTSMLNTMRHYVDAGKDLSINLQLPGFSKESIDISHDGNNLTIKCEKPNNDYQYQFVKRYRIPESHDINAVSAEMKDGILYVTIPTCKTKQKVKSIDIK